MFFRWCGGCGSKKPGLMNMLEAQNTLVSMINPPMLNWTLVDICRILFISQWSMLLIAHPKHLL